MLVFPQVDLRSASAARKKRTYRRWRHTWLTVGLFALGVLSVSISARPAVAHKVYLANENHTDYGWNATTAAYDASMLSELDYYLGRIAATAGNPPAAQARFVADSWYYLWLYEHNRSAAQFQSLIDAMQSGHITVPLNPLVTLYGALPTEAAIRAGYYPGRIERQYGVHFLHGEEMENATIPWGMAAIWAGSAAKYSWKGICACVTSAPYGDRTTDLFRWQGPDGSELLMKWYQFSGDNRSWGGYAEARANLSPAGIQAAIARDTARSVPVSGVFGYGWDDVNSQVTNFETEVAAWNAAHPGGDQAVVSNIIDYFQEVEGSRSGLPIQRGGWGNDWDLLPASLAARTAETRGALERLRTVEAMAAVVHPLTPSSWPPTQATLATGLVDFFKYFEHTWVDGGLGIDSVINNKKGWAQSIDTAVSQSAGAAATALAGLFQTPNEDRFVVFNPLAFARTDIADLPIGGSGPYVVTDVATNTEVPNQVVTLGAIRYLRILASNVPSLGYRLYRYTSGTPATVPNAATIAGSQIESDHYRVSVGARGQLTSAFDKITSMEMAGTGLNDFGSGAAGPPIAENVGPVSATLRVDLSGAPTRRVRVTLVRAVDGIFLDDEILQNYTSNGLYRFNVGLTAPQMRFEEVGAIARPGAVAQGGDFLPGTRADFMTLNHFVVFNDGGYSIVLSNWDAYGMQVGQSTPSAFDLSLPEVSVLALGNLAGSDIRTQGGDTYFRNRFALRGAGGPASAAQAMRMSLAHQNPLQALALPRNQVGPLVAPAVSFLSVDTPNVVVTAFKPAEEGERGWVVRLWELDGTATSVHIDASAFAPTAAYEVSLIETDVAPAALLNGVLQATIGANQLKAYRFVGPSGGTPTATAAPPVRGDVDGNGQVTGDDLTALIAMLFATVPPDTADVNGDGRVGSPDVTALLQLLGSEDALRSSRAAAAGGVRVL